jgi:hypothetical protein
VTTDRQFERLVRRGPDRCDVCSGEAPPEPELVHSADGPRESMYVVVCGPCNGPRAERWVADHLDPVTPQRRAECCEQCGSGGCSCLADERRAIEAEKHHPKEAA